MRDHFEKTSLEDNLFLQTGQEDIAHGTPDDSLAAHLEAGFWQLDQTAVFSSRQLPGEMLLPRQHRLDRQRWGRTALQTYQH